MGKRISIGLCLLVCVILLPNIPRVSATETPVMVLPMTWLTVDLPEGINLEEYLEVGRDVLAVGGANTLVGRINYLKNILVNGLVVGRERISITIHLGENKTIKPVLVVHELKLQNSLGVGDGKPLKYLRVWAYSDMNRVEVCEVQAERILERLLTAVNATVA